MNNQTYFIAVGYPMGRNQFEDDTFIIQLKDRLYKLNSLQHYVWQAAWQLGERNKIEEVFNTYEDGKYKDGFRNILDEFKEVGLVIEIIPESYEGLYQEIKNLCFDKQGVGIGFIPDEEEGIDAYAIELGNYIKVNLIQYLIWSKGNGVTSIDETVLELENALQIKNEDNLEEIILGIINLYSNKLIYFKG